jgi:hypothetical protein
LKNKRSKEKPKWTKSLRHKQIIIRGIVGIIGKGICLIINLLLGLLMRVTIVMEKDLE